MGTSDIIIIDYGVGNIQSVRNALEFLGCKVKVSCCIDEISSASGYILPGVGAFREGMANLTNRNLIDPLTTEVLEKQKPILGICLGMQLLADSSEENGLNKGLGWIKGQVVRLQPPEEFSVPHVGWNNLQIDKKSPLFAKTKLDIHVFFDHSYHFICDKNFISATCNYGHDIVAALEHKNIFGVQFHPEKSQNNGLRILRGFVGHVANYRQKLC